MENGEFIVEEDFLYREIICESTLKLAKRCGNEKICEIIEKAGGVLEVQKEPIVDDEKFNKIPHQILKE